MTFKKLTTVFFLGILTDVILAAYMLCLTRNQILFAAFLCFLVPYTVLIETAWFADATKLRDRIKLTTAAAAGSAVGTVIVMLTFASV